MVKRRPAAKTKRAPRPSKRVAAAVRSVERIRQAAAANYDVGTLRAASDLISRIDLAARAGITYSGARDLYEQLGYARVLRPSDYRERYERGGIAARVVEVLPKATWRAGAELVEDEDPTTKTEFETAWAALDQRLQLWATFCQADILAGLGRFAVILLGIPGELDQEAPSSLAPEDLAYVQAYSELDATVKTWEVDPTNERFGQPTSYTIRIVRTAGFDAGNSKSNVTRVVHWSRVIHIADGTLDDKVFGSPRMKRVWNYLDDLDKVTGAGAEAFWKRADRGLMVNIDPDLKTTQPEIDKAKDSIEEFQHGLKRSIALRGAQVTPLGSDVANLQGPVDAIMTLISASIGMPKRILMGSERGELASSQDRENWEERIEDRRAQYAEPVVVRPFVKHLVDRGALPRPVDDKFDVRWPELDSLTEGEKADVAVKLGGVNKAAGTIVITGAEIRDRVLGLDPLSPEDEAEELEKVKASAPPPPVMVAPGEDPNADPEDELVAEDDVVPAKESPIKAATRRLRVALAAWRKLTKARHVA